LKHFKENRHKFLPEILAMCDFSTHHCSRIKYVVKIHKIDHDNFMFIIRIPYMFIQGCIQKFLDWLPGVRTVNGTDLCHWVQLYHYFVSQFSEFCHHNPLCYCSASVCCCLFCYQLSLETFGYTLVHIIRSLCPIHHFSDHPSLAFNTIPS